MFLWVEMNEKLIEISQRFLANFAPMVSVVKVGELEPGLALLLLLFLFLPVNRAALAVGRRRTLQNGIERRKKLRMLETWGMVNWWDTFNEQETIKFWWSVGSPFTFNKCFFYKGCTWNPRLFSFSVWDILKITNGKVNRYLNLACKAYHAKNTCDILHTVKRHFLSPYHNRIQSKVWKKGDPTMFNQV